LTPARRPTEQFADRLENIRLQMRQIGTGELVDVAVSPDGRTLYAAIGAGGGGGNQPGAILPINIDLYTDADAVASGLQSDLQQYLATGELRRLTDSGGQPIGDEPSLVSVNPDGGEVYLAHGGYAQIIGAPNFFVALAEAIVGTNRYTHLTDPNLLGSGAAGIILEEDKTFLRGSGVTVLDAPGFVGAFGAGHARPGTLGSQDGFFPSEVVFGWQPPAENHGLIVNQVSHPAVYAKEPRGMAIRPNDGKRALLAFGLTGNIGVLDAGTQTAFPLAPPPRPGLFTGLVAVTPSVHFDASLVPDRGAFTLTEGTNVVSPETALQNTGPIVYAQNGKFGVAVHKGTRPPGEEVHGTVPDFEHNESVRQRLLDAGFKIQPGNHCGQDPFGKTVCAGEDYRARQGGGAVTIINDEAISDQLRVNAPASPADRPFYTSLALNDPQEQLFKYQVEGGQPSQFNSPAGVAVQPFVVLETPRFGDQISETTTFLVRLQDQNASGLRFRIVREPDGPGEEEIPGRRLSINFSFEHLTFDQLFENPPLVPPNGTSPHRPSGRYRIEVTLTSATGDISSTSVVVTLP
jgi:hypothetical protein